jgi:hypothetical protein
MRKTFPLEMPGRKRDRVVDSVKHEVRKYVKRERRRQLPEGMDYWDFDCKFGLAAESSEVAHLATLVGRVDAAAKEGAAQVYVEILARPAKRKPKPAVPAEASTQPAPAAPEGTATPEGQ